MKNTRVQTGTIMMAALLLFAIGFTYVGLGSPGHGLGSGFWPMFFVFLIEVGVVYFIIRWIAAAPGKEVHAHQKVDKLLRKLDNEELDLLRSRLIQDEHEAEYGSMADLMQSGKRKNQTHDL